METNNNNNDDDDDDDDHHRNSSSDHAFPALALKLRALGVESWQSFDASDTAAFRALVARLEDTKIRAYAMDERATLRQIASESWPESLRAYLHELNCPYNSDLCREDQGRWLLADWLISRAVSLEYEDDAAAYNATDVNLSGHGGQRRRTVNGVIGGDQPGASSSSSSSLKIAELAQAVIQMSSINRGSQEEKEEGRSNVAKLNHIIALIERCRARDAVLASTDNKRSHLMQQQQQQEEQHTLADCPLGFTLDDADVTAAAKVLRLLYIEDLRQLQNSVDRLVVNVQEYTANPKVDSGMGKVGR